MATNELDKEYRDFVCRLMTKDGKIIPLEVCVLGLVGEWAEFQKATDHHDADEVLKEAGDVLWYIEAIRRHIPLSGGIVSPGGFMFGQDLYVLGELCETVKKHTWHGKELDVRAVHYALSYLEMDIVVCSSVVLHEAKRANMEKLRARYPDGFVNGGGIR